MPSDNQITETDEALVQILALLIGSMTIADPERQAGMDAALAHIRDHFLTAKKSKSAALIENIRRRATDNRSDPALLNLLRKPSQGSA